MFTLQRANTFYCNSAAKFVTLEQVQKYNLFRYKTMCKHSMTVQGIMQKGDVIVAV